MPFMEVVGKGEGVVPAQMGPIGLKVGVTIGFTTMVMVVVVAQRPAEGVKV